MAQIVNKKVKLQLVGLDGNAFSLMGAFQRQARKEKWTREEIDAVLNEAKASDYNHLLYTLMIHCDDGDDVDQLAADYENERYEEDGEEAYGREE